MFYIKSFRLLLGDYRTIFYDRQ